MIAALYDIINILPLSLLSLMLFGKYAGIPAKSAAGYTVCLLFTVWIAVLRNIPAKNRLRSIGVVGVFTAGISIAAGEEYRLLFIEKYLWMLWVIGFCLCALTVGSLMNRTIWIKRVLAPALFVYCVTATVLELEIGKKAFLLMCFIILVYIAEEIQRKWKKSGCPDMKEHITRVAPFLLALCLIMYKAPAPNDPYGWGFAVKIYDHTVSLLNRFYGSFTHRTDDYGVAGFSDDGRFLSGIKNNNEQVMSIKVYTSKVRDFRLVGCISDDFSGREWIFDTETESCSRQLDTIEMSAAVRKYAAEARSDYYMDMSLHCRSLFYNTRYIFSPEKIRLEITKAGNMPMRERNGSIVSDERLNYDDEYDISCYMLNYSNPDLESFLTSGTPVTEEEWNSAAYSERVSGMSGYSFGDYRKYRDDIYERYCRSYGVSDEVGKILDEIKNTSQNRYEAAKKLETYLHGMEYSTDCGALPDSVKDAESFLDYFLFTSQKGYCMHFATAFVLMANEMGIPSRYVQGFNVTRDPYGVITVRQSNAHSWPEVYFDNVGWVAFEPTPGYYASEGWKLTDYSAYVPDNTPGDYTINYEPQKNTADTVEEQRSERISPLIFIIPTFSVISFLILFYTINRAVSEKKYGQMNSHDKFRYMTQQNLRCLGYLGLEIGEGETLSEYLHRLNMSDSEDIKEHLGFIPIYETALYSDREITEEDVASAEKTHRVLRELAAKSRLRFRLLLLLNK